MLKITKIILLLILVTLTLSDCPVQYFPGQTIIGFINAQINGDPEKQNNQQTFTYTMKDPLSTATPDVLLGVNAIDYQFTQELSYKALYQPTPKFGMLNFNVLLQDKSFKWKRLQFNFIATSHSQISAGFISFNTFANDNKTKHNLVTSIKVNDYMKTKPIVQAYVSGISLKPKMTKSEQQTLLKQIDTLKRSPYSWNRAQSAVMSRILVSQSSLSYEIISSSLSNNSLAITFQTSDTLILQSLTVSYIIFNQLEFPLKNNLIQQFFTLSPQKSSYGFNPLSNTDMTFIGLRGAKFNINQKLGIQFLVSKSKGLLNISPAKALLEGSQLYVSFFQTQTKFQFQCENCPDSIFRLQTYCLSTCPRGYVGVKNGTNSYCNYCNISSFFIPSSDGSQCTCATQYFYNHSSSKCESCHYSCLTCKDSTTCESCDSNDKTTKRYFNEKSKLCDCLDGFYDNKNLVCEKCHPTCLTCSGSSIHQCKTCKEGRSLDSTNRCVCGPNFSDQNNQCICKQPNNLMNNICYSTNIVSNSQCNKPHMSESILNGRKICVCEKGFQMFNNECLSCPKTFILNKQTGKCECSKTAYLNTNSGECIQCESMKYYDQRLQKCLCKKQYFQKQDGTCIDCPDKSVYKGGLCMCVFNYYLKDGKCVKCMKTQDDPNCLRVNPNEL